MKNREPLTGDGPAIMRGYKILGHPAVLLVDVSGQEVKRFIGPQPVEIITAALQELLKRVSVQGVE